jgi:hypothetical protein
MNTLRNKILVLVSITLAPSYLFAGTFRSPLQSATLEDFLLAILNVVIYIMYPIIVLMIVYTGFLFVSAQGNPAKLQEARRALVWTVIGALVILGSKALALAIKGTVQSF